MCFVRHTCSAATYDNLTTLCNMTDAPSATVELRRQHGIVTLMKFGELTMQQTCVVNASDGTIFVSDAGTRTASFEEQEKICHNEGGSPVFIKTKEQREAALRAVEDYGTAILSLSHKHAWITATWTKTQDGQRKLFWPDGSAVTDCAYKNEDLDDTSDNLACMINSDDKLEDFSYSKIIKFPVLCKKN
ncbi:C-type lectin-like [Trinorchestia longiramus]|nr:C-type lectin-like [Trinorchestia longiramus]